MEKRKVIGVTTSRDDAEISLLAVPNEPGRAALIFDLLSEADINIDMIVQSQARASGAANISFTMKERDLDRAMEALAAAKEDIGYADIAYDRDVAIVSVVGAGMKSHTGVASSMFRALGDRAINIRNISTSEIKISVLIRAEYAELAVRALHQAYGLDKATA